MQVMTSFYLVRRESIPNNNFAILKIDINKIIIIIIVNYQIGELKKPQKLQGVLHPSSVKIKQQPREFIIQREGKRTPDKLH